MEMNFNMDNEIKTFVYRAGQVRKEAARKAKELRKKLTYAVIALVVLVTSVTAVFVIGSDRKNASADELVETGYETASVEAETELPDITEEAEAEQPQTSNGTFTNISQHAAQHKEVPFYAALEEDDGLMLLGIDEGSETIYFPADRETESLDESDPETAEESTAAEAKTSETEETAADEGKYSSRIEEVAEKIDDATAPDDVPSKLTFVYNPKMILDLDEENLTALYRIVEAEATDQDVYGRMLVANVVINRTYAGFSSTVKGVIFQTIGGSQQFAPIRDGRYYTVEVTSKTKEAVDRVLKGEDYSNGALYFFQRDLTTAQKAAWFDNELKYLFKYGCHEFYTEKNR